ncbi:response regulator transcription factor [Kitasatospora sp. NA04385]|uniref:response regulator transcription factor n=1 Tax=Kitasatospora sp. NA04385 TaxID=2742135 RepID=UPI0015917826|nr:response regulator transcription factor [Kitasatospora sp. NA04385]QKW20263.1 response regulator transcription factor [Kitasatospora sp. NA04385]
MNRPATHLLEPPPAPHRGPRALRVLVVEGDAHAAAPLLRALARQGYAAHGVTTGAEALRAHPDADLVLLDLDLPDLDGLEVCRGIRAVADTPIITVTARGSELDRVLGLQAGSDDYLVKPYGFRELLARMEAVLRRTRTRPPARPVLVHGPLRIDAGARLTTLHGTPVDLTRKEFDLLHLLAAHPGTVLPRRQIMARVWADTWSPRGRTVDTHVSTLRAKLGPGWIVTVRGIGFRLGHPG